MKYHNKILILLGCLFLSTPLLADEPTVQQNVTVLQNATTAQCQAAARGEAGPQDMVGYSGGGEYTGTTGPGVRSCTGCAVDSQNNCVCKMCYYYFD